MVVREYKINGMNCEHCVMAVKKQLSKLALENFDVEVGSAKIKFDDTKVTEQNIIVAISEAGYQVIE